MDILDHDPTPPRTLHELAQRSVDNARAKLECAAIELAGAMERQRMVMAQEDRPLAPSKTDHWTPPKDFDWLAVRKPILPDNATKEEKILAWRDFFIASEVVRRATE